MANRADAMSLDEVMELWRAAPPRFDPLGLSYPSTFLGDRLYEVEPRIVAKIRLRDECPVSDKFRAEMNQWLLDTFGTRDDTPIQRGMMIQSMYGWHIRKDDMLKLSACI